MYGNNKENSLIATMIYIQEREERDEWIKKMKPRVAREMSQFIKLCVGNERRLF